VTTQYEEEKRLLPIAAVAKAGGHLTAEKPGRPRSNASTVAQVCDLLDAAAA
jgi:hypothetical protein